MSWCWWIGLINIKWISDVSWFKRNELLTDGCSRYHLFDVKQNIAPESARWLGAFIFFEVFGAPNSNTLQHSQLMLAVLPSQKLKFSRLPEKLFLRNYWSVKAASGSTSSSSTFYVLAQGNFWARIWWFRNEKQQPFSHYCCGLNHIETTLRIFRSFPSQLSFLPRLAHACAWSEINTAKESVRNGNGENRIGAHGSG